MSQMTFFGLIADGKFSRIGSSSYVHFYHWTFCAFQRFAIRSSLDSCAAWLFSALERKFQASPCVFVFEGRPATSPCQWSVPAGGYKFSLGWKRNGSGTTWKHIHLERCHVQYLQETRSCGNRVAEFSEILAFLRRTRTEGGACARDRSQARWFFNTRQHDSAFIFSKCLSSGSAAAELLLVQTFLGSLSSGEFSTYTTASSWRLSCQVALPLSRRWKWFFFVINFVTIYFRFVLDSRAYFSFFGTRHRKPQRALA